MASWDKQWNWAGIGPAMQHLNMQRLRTENRIKRSLHNTEAAEQHNHKLKQGLRKTPGDRGPSKERLAVFSDVFNDVCDGSAVFGCMLREIKLEYDLYLKYLLSSQLSLQVTSECTPLGSLTRDMELDRAAKQVLSLEEQVSRALEDNDRVRIEYENAQAKAMENVSGPHPEQDPEGISSPNKQDKLLDVQQYKECDSSVESKRQKVWSVCKEVQRLQTELDETMMSTATTSAPESCLEVSDDEIKHLMANNERLRSYNKVLEQNILMALDRENVSEETEPHMWKKIWNTLNGDD